jgi:hypothetical protein
MCKEINDFPLNSLHMERIWMYEYISHRENQLLLPDDFFLPFGGKLNKENRWVKLAQLVPWAYAEEKYAKSFRNSFRGQKAVSIRVALGALIIQERLQLSDRETVQQIAPDQRSNREHSSTARSPDRTWQSESPCGVWCQGIRYHG